MKTLVVIAVVGYSLLVLNSCSTTTKMNAFRPLVPAQHIGEAQGDDSENDTPEPANFLLYPNPNSDQFISAGIQNKAVKTQE